MGDGEPKRQLERGFERIEETILPSVSMMLDALLEAASLARPGHDCESFADELRTLGLQLESLTRQIEAATPVALVDPADYRFASTA